jgi:hypothetical protein
MAISTKQVGLTVLLATCGCDTEPSTELVQVAVTSDGKALPGAVIVAGEPGRIALTDLDGRAAVDLASGEPLTIARYDSAFAGYELQSVLGVEPGDELDIRFGAPAGFERVATADVRLPGGFDNASSYAVSVGCTSALVADAAPVVSGLDVLARCTGPAGEFHVLAMARDGNGRPLAFSFAQYVSPTSPRTAVALPAWRTDFAEFDVEMIGLAGDPDEATVEIKLTTDAGAFDLVTLESPDRILVPGAFGGCVHSQTRIDFDGGSMQIAENHVESSPISILGDAMLPRIEGVTFEQDATGRFVTHQMAGAADSADALTAEIYWSNHTWTVIASAGQDRLRLPSLPDDLVAWDASANSPLGVLLRAVDLDAVDDYAVIRAAPHQLFDVTPYRASEGWVTADTL